MKVSVVIPVYKSYSYLHRALASLVIPNIPSLSVCVVLVDDSPGLINCRKKKLSRIVEAFPHLRFRTIFNLKNRGVTFSRNRGIRAERADVYVFLDSDDTFSCDALETIHNVVTSSEKDVGVFLFRTDRNTDKSDNIGSFQLLLKDYTSGERLVVVRRGAILPFYSALRGHELAGLLRFCIVNNYGVALCSQILRKYHDDNIHALSKGKELRLRLKLIQEGHCKVVKICLSNYLPFYAVMFFLRFINMFLRKRLT